MQLTADQIEKAKGDGLRFMGQRSALACIAALEALGHEVAVYRQSASAASIFTIKIEGNNPPCN